MFCWVVCRALSTTGLQKSVCKTVIKLVTQNPVSCIWNIMPIKDSSFCRTLLQGMKDQLMWHQKLKVSMMWKHIISSKKDIQSIAISKDGQGISLTSVSQSLFNGRNPNIIFHIPGHPYILPEKFDRRNTVHLLLNYSQENIFVKECYTHACECIHMCVCTVCQLTTKTWTTFPTFSCLCDICGILVTFWSISKFFCFYSMIAHGTHNGCFVECGRKTSLTMVTL